LDFALRAHQLRRCAPAARGSSPLGDSSRRELGKRAPARVRKTLIRPDDKERKSISIFLLDKAEDEAAAIAVSDEGAPSAKPAKKGGTSKK